MKRQPKKATRGGARKGAGKKAMPADQKKGTRCHTYTPEVLAFLDTVEGQSIFIESLIRKSPAFKKWQSEQPNEKGK